MDYFFYSPSVVKGIKKYDKSYIELSKEYNRKDQNWRIRFSFDPLERLYYADAYAVIHPSEKTTQSIDSLFDEIASELTALYGDYSQVLSPENINETDQYIEWEVFSNPPTNCSYQLRKQTTVSPSNTLVHTEISVVLLFVDGIDRYGN